MRIRVGEGIDRHRLIEGIPLILGGVELEHPKGLSGHSDGDALFHAVCDALLGALALGDLGQMFSDTDPTNENRDSAQFVKQVAARVRAAGFEIGNVDATIMAEAPRIAPHANTMRENLARALEVDVGLVSVKATRGEKVGPEGKGKAITVRAVALVHSEAGDKA